MKLDYVQLINQMFQIYKNNWDEKVRIDEELVITIDSDQWVTNLKNRAKRQQEMFVENEALIQQVMGFLHEQGNQLSEDIAKTLYDNIMELYYNDYDDFYLIISIVDILIAHYRGKGEYSTMVDLFGCNGYQKLEALGRVSQDVTTENILEDILSAIGYKAFFQQLNTSAKRKIFSAYYNLIIVCLDSKKIDIEISYYFLREMILFAKIPYVKSFLENDERLHDFIDRIKQEWLGFHQEVLHASEEIKQAYIAISEEFMQQEIYQKESFEELPYEIFVGHITASTMKGNISSEQACQELINYYQLRSKYLLANQIESNGKLIDASFDYMNYLYFFINMPQIILKWISHYQLKSEKYTPYIVSYLHDLEQKWKELYKNLPAFFLDQFIMDTCIELINVMDDKKVQEQWINTLMVKRHLSTYIHCTMVAELAKLIGESLLCNKPEVFVGLWDYSLEEVKQNQSQILDFLINSAYFHDIGKHRIANIINTQTRKISDIEYRIIMDHPNHGRLFAEKLELLQPYQDVIMGHHKFYDGTKGYPVQFDNTASEVRIVIDLITICDCIDAATDTLGRNYSAKKNFDEVMQEIYEQRGTRYNPDIAEYLMSQEELKQTLDYIVTDGRIENCRKIYEEYFSAFNQNTAYLI